MIAASTETAQPFPAFLAPPPNARPLPGTHVYLLENSRLGFGAFVTAQQPGFPSANRQNALGIPTTVRQTRVGSRCSGKERDVETGLDFFDARYFSAAQGRFTSPDWSEKPAPVPYADFRDPQSLNLYGYVRNNPLGRADTDGHQAAGGMLLPDRDTVQLAVGVFKGWVNGHLQDQGSLLGRGLTALGVQPQVASNNMQAAGMAASPVVVTAVAVALPGPKGEAGEASPAESPAVHPSEVMGKTPAEIDGVATGKGLIPKGPDPTGGKGAYVDPVTGEQRVLIHPDPDPGHAHVNNPAGERLGPSGQVVPRESPEAHLPIKKNP